jgi:hypothetical protein
MTIWKKSSKFRCVCPAKKSLIYLDIFKKSYLCGLFLIFEKMENIAANYERVGIDDMKKNYPDEWILLGNPESDKRDINILSGILLYHSRDKREVAYLGRPLVKDYEKVALFFNRVTPRPKRGIISSTFGPKTVLDDLRV